MIEPPSISSTMSAPAHHEDAVTRGQKLGQVVGNHDHAKPLCPEIADDVMDLGFRSHIDAHRGPVQDQHLSAARASQRASATRCWFPPRREVNRRRDQRRDFTFRRASQSDAFADEALHVEKAAALIGCRAARPPRCAGSTASGNSPSVSRSSGT